MTNVPPIPYFDFPAGFHRIEALEISGLHIDRRSTEFGDDTLWLGFVCPVNRADEEVKLAVEIPVSVEMLSQLAHTFGEMASAWAGEADDAEFTGDEEDEGDR